MAKKRRPAKRGEVSDANLAELPQVAGEIWQADIRRTPAWVRIAGVLQRPWMILVTSRTRDQVLSHEMPDETPDEAMLWDNLAAAMHSPDAGHPHRPARVELSDERLCKGLEATLERIGVDCIVRPELEHVEFVLDDLARNLQGGRSIPSLIDVPGLERPQAKRYYTAAASFYRRRPWRDVAGDTPIRVECSKFHSGPWYAVVLGQSGMVMGMALHEGEHSLREILGGGMEEERGIRNTSAISLMYGDKFEIAVKDLDAGEAEHWEVAGSGAYPLAVRVNPGRAVRAPLAWELELLEACLWSIPDFLSLNSRTAACFKVPSVSEGLELRLSWAG